MSAYWQVAVLVEATRKTREPLQIAQAVRWKCRKKWNNDTDLRNVRKYLISKYGHKCSICGLSEWMGQPIPLVADHIDGDTTNHKVENFRMVCENCNAQLPTYKSKNKYGRAWRKKYYEKYYHDEEK